jgi:hypothetical protein
MSSDKPKSATAKPAAAEAPAAKTGSEPKQTGRVQFDDRGNAIWEWQIATGAFGTEVSTQRLQKLEHPALSLADEGTRPNTVRANPLGAKKGYDPYDSGRLGKRPPPAKKDLRKLSEWLKLKKQASEKKDDESDD